MWDKVARGQIFSEYFGFLCQFLFHRLLNTHHHHHHHHHHHLSSGAGKIGQLVADSPHSKKLKKKNTTFLWRYSPNLGLDLPQ
jgi:hypothetical protein